MKRALFGLVAIATIFSGPAAAHQLSLTYGELKVSGKSVSCELRFASADLARLLSLEAAPSQTTLLADKAMLFSAVFGNFEISAGGAPCDFDGSNSSLAPDGEDGFILRGRYACPSEPSPLKGRAGFLDSLPAGHTLLLKIAAGDASDESLSERVLQKDVSTFIVENQQTVRFAAARFYLLGIEHIFTGTDHICFLIGLLLLGGSLLNLIQIVTAFTIAHSITLALAAMQIFSPPPSIIEPAIAASILFIAVENLWVLRKQARDPGAAARALKHRWMVTFAFGLVHGFGFADALTSLHLPRASLAASLVTFNLGVETGQVCIVAAALPLLAALRRLPAFSRRGPQLLSLGVGLAGAFWLVQRIF